MADTKISDLTVITGADTAADDDFVVVDTSAAQTKRITRDELKAAVLNTGAVTIGGAVSFNAIAETKAVTAVDVFVYDTSKDSDGGAWRDRTQATSWYNETLNTATRGARRNFLLSRSSWRSRIRSRSMTVMILICQCGALKITQG